jgi:hypothetical protein
MKAKLKENSYFIGYFKKIKIKFKRKKLKSCSENIQEKALKSRRRVERITTIRHQIKNPIFFWYKSAAY